MPEGQDNARPTPMATSHTGSTPGIGTGNQQATTHQSRNSQLRGNSGNRNRRNKNRNNNSANVNTGSSNTFKGGTSAMHGNVFQTYAET